MIRISRAEPSAQDQQQPVELRRAAFEVEALTSDCDSRELVGGTVFPQIQVDYSVWHATSCLRNRKTSSGSSSNKYGKLGCKNALRYGFLRLVMMRDILPDPPFSDYSINIRNVDTEPVGYLGPAHTTAEWARTIHFFDYVCWNVVRTFPEGRGPTQIGVNFRYPLY